MILGRDQENLNDVLDLVGLGAWLREHDPELYNQLQGASLTLSSDDLSALHDPDAIYTHLRRLRASVDTDPEHAVGVAKELVESTVKLVLLQLDVEFDNSDDLPRLAKQAQRALLLHAGTISPDSKGADATKKVLNGLTQIAVGIAELRNHYGTGHGRTASATGLKPRHAAVDRLHSQESGRGRHDCREWTNGCRCRHRILPSPSHYTGRPVRSMEHQAQRVGEMNQRQN